MSYVNRRPRGASTRSSSFGSQQNIANVNIDDRLLNLQHFRAQIVRPRLQGGQLVVRVWPALRPDKPDELLPGRLASFDTPWSEFAVTAPTARLIGIDHPRCRRANFIVGDPRQDASSWADMPFPVLTRVGYRAYMATKNNTGSAPKRWQPSWQAYFEGGQKSIPAVPKLTMCCYALCHVYRNGGLSYVLGQRGYTPLGLLPDDPLVVLQLTNSAAQTWFELIDRRAAEPANDESQPWLDLKFYDPVGVFDPETRTVSGGHITTFFNTAIDAIAGENSSYSGERRQDNVMARFDVCVEPSKMINNRQFVADLDAKQTQVVVNKAQFFFDDKETGDPGLLRVIGLEEQAVLVAKAYAVEPDLLRFCWADYPEFFTDEVKAILADRHVAVMSEAVPEEMPEEKPVFEEPRRVDVTQQAASRPAPKKVSPVPTPRPPAVKPMSTTPAQGGFAPPKVTGEKKPVTGEPEEIPADEKDFTDEMATDEAATGTETSYEEDASFDEEKKTETASNPVREAMNAALQRAQKRKSSGA